MPPVGVGWSWHVPPPGELKLARRNHVTKAMHPALCMAVEGEEHEDSSARPFIEMPAFTVRHERTLNLIII